MKILLLFAIGLFLIESCLSLTCTKCDRSKCRDNPANCRYGWTLDICHCCPDCYKGIGEKCGTFWGKCASPWRCVKQVSDRDSPTTAAYTIGWGESGFCALSSFHYPVVKARRIWMRASENI